jgi:hypothetical protein
LAPVRLTVSRTGIQSAFQVCECNTNRL